MTHNLKKIVSDELKIAVFASGRGSNFEAILKAIQAGTIKGARIVGVISNNSGAGALETAAKNGIPAYTSAEGSSRPIRISTATSSRSSTPSAPISSSSPGT